MADYRYYIVDSLSVETEVFPVNKDSYTFDFEKRKGSSLYFEKKLSGNLIFTNRKKESIFDFDYFKDKETNDKCYELELRIYKKCVGNYNLYWEGLFSVLEGKFDNDNCIYEIKPRVKYDIKSDIDFNFLDSPPGDGYYNVRTGNLLLGTERMYYNGRSLKTILLFLAQKSNSKITGIISDFFRINSVGDIDYSNDYQIFSAPYNQLALFPLSEIQEPVPSDRAKKEMVSLDKLMNDLNALFDVFWFIDSNYKLRVEHRVFFEKDLGLDLTQSKFEKYLIGTNKISYNLEDFPKVETFKIAGSKQYAKLTYYGCGDINKNENEKIYATNVINTYYYDIRYGGYGTINSNASGLFMFACYTTLSLKYAYPDYYLSQPYLVYRYRRYGRPSSNNSLEIYIEDEDLQVTKINQGQMLAYSMIPTKEQSEISIPICCDDEFDASKKITTNIGIGYLNEAKLNMKTNSLSLKLKYKSEDDNVSILPNQLNGCTLWLTGNTGVVYDGSNRVSEWKDQSGNNNHATQINNANKPIYNVSGKSLLCNLGTGPLFLTTPSIQLFPSKRGSIFLISSCYGLLSDGTMSIISTNIGNKFDVSCEVDYTAGTPFGTTTHKIKSTVLNQYFPLNPNGSLLQINRESDTTQTIYHRGLIPSSLSGNPMTIPNLQVNAAPLIIGKNSIYANYGVSQISELIIFDRVLDDLERQQIELYLIKKYGPLDLYSPPL